MEEQMNEVQEILEAFIGNEDEVALAVEIINLPYCKDTLEEMGYTLVESGELSLTFEKDGLTVVLNGELTGASTWTLTKVL